MVRLARAALLAVWLAALPALALAQVMDPPVVIDGFERARGEGKIDLALSYFADNATIYMPNGSAGVVGKAEIRRFLQTSRTPPLITSSRHVVGNTITWTERHDVQPNAPRTGMPRPLDLTVEAVVQDGKIKALTYSLAVPAAPPPQDPNGAARIPAPVAMSGVAVLATALLAVAFLVPRRRASESSLQGKLVAGLGQWRLTARAG